MMIRLVLVILLLALSGCSGQALPAGTVETRVDPLPNSGRLLLACIASSSGQCYFRIGAAHFRPRVYAIPIGSRLVVAPPSEAQPYCTSYAFDAWRGCPTGQRLMPDGLIVAGKIDTSRR
jgi:hypothetical protein